MTFTVHDEEKNAQSIAGVEVDSSGEDASTTPRRVGFLERLRNYEDALDRKLGVEAHSIERKTPENRNPFYARWTGQLAMIGLWVGGCMNLGTFATGFLGWQLGLDLRQSILIIIFGTAVGAAVTSWCATMGAPTGLRQVSICRYSFGWYPAKVIAILNIVQEIGWCASGSITGGQALSAFSDGKIGAQVGVIIVSVVSLVLSFFGMKAVYLYANFSWLIFLAMFLIIFGEIVTFGNLSAPPSVSGATGSGAALTFFGIMYGSSACCAGYVSDYYVEYPKNMSKMKVFSFTFIGLYGSTVICAVSGAIAASALSNDQYWNQQYGAGIGFLVQAMVYPYGLAKVLLFLMMFTSIGLNCACMYSVTLSIQQAARSLAVIPRFAWTIVCFAAVIALGLAGSDRLLAYLQNFLSLLGYYSTAIFVVLITEHYLFRRGVFANYNLEVWDKRAMLPIGYAGGFAFILGVVGAILGMATTWYTGVLAKLIGDYGGDIGNELCFLLSLAAYVPARIVERRLVGR